jgi:hypothetical protein
MDRSKVILLDVDGPLNPFAAKPTKRPEGYETLRMTPRGWVATKPLKVWLNPLHGPALTALGVELIWCTMWENEANEWIGPHLGLPELSFIDWIDWDTGNWEGLHPKTKRIVSWMKENRPNCDFIWIDDEPTGRDAEFLARNCDVDAKIMKISPKIGLVDVDFDNIKKWVGNK